MGKKLSYPSHFKLEMRKGARSYALAALSMVKLGMCKAVLTSSDWTLEGVASPLLSLSPSSNSFQYRRNRQRLPLSSLHLSASSFCHRLEGRSARHGTLSRPWVAFVM